MCTNQVQSYLHDGFDELSEAGLEIILQMLTEDTQVPAIHWIMEMNWHWHIYKAYATSTEKRHDVKTVHQDRTTSMQYAPRKLPFHIGHRLSTLSCA